MATQSKPPIKVAFELPLEHRQAMERLAEENDRTLSAEVRRAVAAYLVKQEEG